MRFPLFVFVFIVTVSSQSVLAAECRPGAKVEAKWKDSWWKATIKNAKGDTCCVHYDGYDANLDECVPTVSHIRIHGKFDKPLDYLTVKVGDKVEGYANSFGWHNGTVIGIDTSSGYPNFFRIHFDGRDDSWDEWLGKEKIRRRGNL